MTTMTVGRYVPLFSVISIPVCSKFALACVLFFSVSYAKACPNLSTGFTPLFLSHLVANFCAQVLQSCSTHSDISPLEHVPRAKL